MGQRGDRLNFRLITTSGLTTIFLVSLLSANPANATLLVDLRFSDGSHSRSVEAGSHTVEVWAQMRGTNTTGTDEAILYLHGAVQSQQVNGGAILAGSSGVAANWGVGPIFTTVPYFGSPGSPQNRTADGVQDWGTTSTSNTNTIKYNTTLLNNEGIPGTGMANISTAGVTANYLDEGSSGAGVEFKVGEFRIDIDALDVNISVMGAETLFTWINGTGSAPYTHIARADGINEFAKSKYLAPLNSISFFVPERILTDGELIPEPNSVALLGMSLLGLVCRRKQPRQ